MEYELLKVENTVVDIDFEKIFDYVKKDYNASRDEFDSDDEYYKSIADFFGDNVTVFLYEIYGLNFSELEEGPYYDIDTNDDVLSSIADDFYDYLLYNKPKI